MKKYTYSYEVILTQKVYIDVEANDGDEAQKALDVVLDDLNAGKANECGVSHKNYPPEITLVERSDNDNDFGDDH